MISEFGMRKAEKEKIKNEEFRNWGIEGLVDWWLESNFFNLNYNPLNIS